MTETTHGIRKKLDAARQQIASGEPGEAFDVLVALAEQHPTYETLMALGECHLRLNHPKLAITPLAAATGLSDHARPAGLLAEALLRVGRKDDALLIAQRILRRDPKNRQAMQVMQSTRGD